MTRPRENRLQGPTWQGHHEKIRVAEQVEVASLMAMSSSAKVI